MSQPAEPGQPHSPPVRAPARAGLQTGPAVVISISLASFTNALSQNAFAPFLPLIAQTLGTSVALLGQVPATSTLLAAILGLAVGPLADRYGQRMALVVGLIGLASGGIGVAISQSYLFLLIVMMSSAIGRATVLPVSMVIGGTRFVGDAQRRALSWVSTGLAVAPIIGIPILTTIGEYLGWRGAFATIAMVCLGTAVLAWSGLGPDPKSSGKAFRPRDLTSPYGAILRHRPTVLLILSSLVCNIAYWNVITYVGAFWIEEHGLSLHEVGLVTLAMGVGGLSGSWLVSSPLGRLNPYLMAALGRVGANVLFGIPLVFWVPTPVAVLCFALASALTGYATVASSLILTNDSAPGARATTLTANGAAWSFGLSLGAASGGLALTLGGYPALGLHALAMIIIGGGLIMLAGQASRTLRAAQVPAVAVLAPRRE